MNPTTTKDFIDQELSKLSTEQLLRLLVQTEEFYKIGVTTPNSFYRLVCERALQQKSVNALQLVAFSLRVYRYYYITHTESGFV